MATPTAFKIGRGFQFNDGDDLAVSPADQARIRFNLDEARFEQSIDGGAYTALAPGGGATLPALYAAGTAAADSRIPLDDTRQGVWVQDNATPLSVPLFVVSNAAGNFGYLSVRSSRTSIAQADLVTDGLPVLQVTPGNHTALAASTENLDVDFVLNRSVEWDTGALALQRFFRVRAPTIAFVAASTVTDAATFFVEGAPAQGTNATITNAYALWVGAGRTRLGGGLAVDGGTTANTITSNVADGASAVGLAVDNTTAFSTTGATLATFSSAGTVKVRIGRQISAAFDVMVASPGGFYNIARTSGIQTNDTRVFMYGGSSNEWAPVSDVTIAMGSASNRFTNVWSRQHSGVEQTIAAAATIALNPASGESIRITLSATSITTINGAAGNPGQVMRVEIIQDGTGGRSISGWSSSTNGFQLAGGAYTVTATLNKRDILTFMWDSVAAKWIEISRSMNV